MQNVVNGLTFRPWQGLSRKLNRKYYKLGSKRQAINYFFLPNLIRSLVTFYRQDIFFSNLHVENKDWFLTHRESFLV